MWIVTLDKYISVFSVNSELSEGCLSGFETLEFCYEKIGTRNSWSLNRPCNMSVVVIK